jgi:hypothetical protein
VAISSQAPEANNKFLPDDFFPGPEADSNRIRVYIRPMHTTETHYGHLPISELNPIVAAHL